MSFANHFVGAGEDHGQSIAQFFASDLGARADVYDDGLITLLDEQTSRSALIGWDWFLGKDAVALASTWQGNVLFWSPTHKGGFFLETQRGKTTFIDREVKYIFDEFLTASGAKEQLLDKARFTLVRERLGALKFGECYIAEPWPLLGGSGAPETYGRGALDVYLNLVGQTIKSNLRV